MATKKKATTKKSASKSAKDNASDNQPESPLRHQFESEREKSRFDEFEVAGKLAAFVADRDGVPPGMNREAKDAWHSQLEKGARDLMKTCNDAGLIVYDASRRQAPMATTIEKGCTAVVGSLTFLMPDMPPADDQEVIDYEETIARVEKAAAPYNAVVDAARKAAKTIRELITREFRNRLDAEADDQLELFEEEKESN